MTCSMIRIFFLLIFTVTTSFSQNSADKGLGVILDSDGSIKSGLNGSFDASGFEMQLDPNTGKPFFQPVSNHNSTTSTISWEKISAGVGSEGTSNQLPSNIKVVLVVGTNIYIGGQFRTISNILCNSIARWDGTSWNPVGTGVNGYLYALTHDGTNLYAGGSFTTAGGNLAHNVAMWNGTSWSALGNGLDAYVYALQIFKGKLYAGGYFTGSGEIVLNKIAVWNGSSWGTVGSNMYGNLMGKMVNGLEATESYLYVGGNFINIGGIAVNNIAKWDGTSWSIMGMGVNTTVRALLSVNTVVYAAGDFTTAGGITVNHIAKWDGSSWSSLGTGTNGAINALATDGTNIYAGGSFGMAGGVTAAKIAKWNGSSWTSFITTPSLSISALAWVGSTLYIGGGYSETFGISDGVTITYPGYQFDIPSEYVYVKSLCIIGNSLYVGGKFTSIDGTVVSNIAEWDGSSWHALGTGADGEVSTLISDGTYLYAGGAFNSIGGVGSRLAKWDGSSWSNVGGKNLTGGGVYTLMLHNGILYAAGDFIWIGSENIRRVAKFDGTNWYGFGEGIMGSVNALAHDGTSLYAGGIFTIAGTTAVNNIAKWNGSTWEALGTGLNNVCRTLLFYEGNLYAGGYYIYSSDGTIDNIAKWDGVQWSAFGLGVSSDVFCLIEMNGDIYAAGDFNYAGENPIRYLAKWNGTTWLDVGSNLDAGVYTILPSWHYQGFIVGGKFTSFNQTTISKRIVKFTDSDNPLPVELVSFSGSLRSGVIHLNWETSTEVDNYGFEIERKETFSEWQKMGFVEGNGTSNSPKYYSFSDNSTLNGSKYHYRLKQIDGDGSFTYSNILEISTSEITGYSLEQNFPNPFNPSTVIRFDLPAAGDIRLEVFNILGEKVATLMEGFQEAGVFTVNFTADEIASGVYFYTLEAGDKKLTRKMILLR